MEELISASVLPSNFGSEDHGADDADTSDLRRQSDAFSLSVAALDWIHRKRLWTQRAASFGEYARVRWNVTRQRLYQIIKCKAILDVRGPARAPVPSRTLLRLAHAHARS